MDIIFITSFAGTIILLFYALGYVLYITKKDQEFEKKRAEVYYNSAQILNSAREKAKAILQDSEARANQILIEADNTKISIEQDFNQALSQVVNSNTQEINRDSGQLLTEYKSSLTNLKNKYLEEIEAMIAKMEGSMQTEFSQFQTVLEKDTKQAENTLSSNITAELQKTKIELENYKKSQVAKIDEMVANTVIKIAREVIGKTITPQEHEKLIMQALEQAKKEGVLN